MFCAEMENRFPNKWRNGYTALVIIEAIQVYRILAGRGARAGKMMSTINDVSRLAGVSKATVSRVLSGSRGVKEASRQAVLQAAEALNYRPNMIAQSLLSQSTGCIGVICAQLQHQPNHQLSLRPGKTAQPAPETPAAALRQHQPRRDELSGGVDLRAVR